jgi:hypothetical protein
MRVRIVRCLPSRWRLTTSRCRCRRACFRNRLEASCRNPSGASFRRHRRFHRRHHRRLRHHPNHSRPIRSSGSSSNHCCRCAIRFFAGCTRGRWRNRLFRSTLRRSPPDRPTHRRRAASSMHRQALQRRARMPLPKANCAIDFPRGVSRKKAYHAAQSTSQLASDPAWPRPELSGLRQA